MSTKFLKKSVATVSAVAMGLAMLATPFVSEAALGALYNDAGTVYFHDKSGQKRAFTSAGAFESYNFTFGEVQPMNAEVSALPTGSLIPPRDGSIFCATATKGTDVAGECSLITGGQKAAFTSAAVFTGLGFSFANAKYGDSSFLSKTTNIDNATDAHRPGVLVNNGGTVQLVVPGGLWGISSLDIFNGWRYNFANVVPANNADKLLTQVGVIPARMAGELNPTSTMTDDDDNDSPTDCNNLSGSTGSITVSPLSDYSGEEVGEGEDDVPVMAFEVEADNDSDVAITSVKVELDENGAGSEDLDDYAGEVSIWHGDDMLGSADVEDFDETDVDGTWTKTIALDCAAVGADETEEFTVAVSGNNVIDSNDLGEAWLVDILNIRFEDGDGVVTTEDTDGDGLDKTFTFESFADATDIELNASLTDDADDINEGHVIDIDDADDTDDVEILAFTLENEGDSDILVNDIPVTITTTGETDEAVLLLDATLWQDGDQISSDTVPTGGAVEFEDLDIELGPDDTVDLVVAVSIQDTAGAADNGDTVQATLDVANIDAEDEEGDDLAGGDLTGSAVGEAHGVFDAGIMVELVSTDVEITDSDTATIPDRGNFTIVFDVTAFDSDVFIDGSAITDEAGGATYQNIDAVGCAATAIIDSPADDAANSTFRVDEGTTERFTVTGDCAGTDAFANFALESVLYALTAIDGDVLYTFNMADFRTENVFLEAN